jgi:hypothetical protein
MVLIWMESCFRNHCYRVLYTSTSDLWVNSRSRAPIETAAEKLFAGENRVVSAASYTSSGVRVRPGEGSCHMLGYLRCSASIYVQPINRKARPAAYSFDSAAGLPMAKAEPWSGVHETSTWHSEMDVASGQSWHSLARRNTLIC